MKLLTARAAGVLADTINDANSTRKVYLLAAGLAALGLLLIAITVWFWRSTRHDPELLGPLEVLGGRKFRKLAGNEQRQILEESRPGDVKPLQWGVERGGRAGGPAVTASAFDAALVVADGEAVEPESDSVSGLPASADSGDPHSDLDSILAAAGAVVPGRAVSSGAAVAASPAPAGVADSNGSPAAADDVAVADPVSSGAAVPVDGDAKSADAKSAAAAGDGERPSVAADAKSLGGGHEPLAPEPAVMPLLIVPVDHDLRPSLSRTADPVVAPREPNREADRSVEAPDVVDLHDTVDTDFDDDHDDHDALDAHDPDDHDDHEAYDDFAGLGELDADEAEADADPTASIDPLLRMFNRNDP